MKVLLNENRTMSFTSRESHTAINVICSNETLTKNFFLQSIRVSGEI